MGLAEFQERSCISALVFLRKFEVRRSTKSSLGSVGKAFKDSQVMTQPSLYRHRHEQEGRDGKG